MKRYEFTEKSPSIETVDLSIEGKILGSTRITKTLVILAENKKQAIERFDKINGSVEDFNIKCKG